MRSAWLLSCLRTARSRWFTTPGTRPNASSSKRRERCATAASPLSPAPRIADRVDELHVPDRRLRPSRPYVSVAAASCPPRLNSSHRIAAERAASKRLCQAKRAVPHVPLRHSLARLKRRPSWSSASVHHQFKHRLIRDQVSSRDSFKVLAGGRLVVDLGHP